MFDFLKEHWAFAPYLSLILFLSLMSLRERRPSPAGTSGRGDRQSCLRRPVVQQAPANESVRNATHGWVVRRSASAPVCGA